MHILINKVPNDVFIFVFIFSESGLMSVMNNSMSQTI